MNQTIGIIGYGKLGTAIAGRAEETGHRVLVSDDETHNKEVVRESGIVTLCIKPDKIFEVADQIRENLNGTKVLSFMAATPLAKLRQTLDTKNVQRAMTTLGLDSIICTQGDADITEFCRKLTRGKLISTTDESQVDMFTAAVGCLPGIAAWWYKNYRKAADEWLKKWEDFLRTHLAVDRELLEKIIKDTKEKGEYEEEIRRVKTPGGITEAMLTTLEKDCFSKFEDILSAAMKRTEEIAR
jgi:pyrroline-5-carboxylate reductase